ncbi:unnamed protein product [Haemonchus placei]|uniref:Uncharacterized protein n=1 Tax=Haemonchus placei TaxID=6290 RepID=A0A158QLL6_HAEPC|nr:unnamed protein product [Haemonchus placei]
MGGYRQRYGTCERTVIMNINNTGEYLPLIQNSFLIWDVRQNKQ